MACPHCGSDRPAVGGVCPACGARVTTGAALAPDAPTMAPGFSPPPAAAPAAPTPATLTGSGTRAQTARDATVNVGPLTLGQEFGTRYRILKTLGAGGMGAVYQAWDEALGVAVALKVIRPEALADPGAAQEVERRFKRELLLARQVTHRNVVRIHDLGEIDGIKYLTMPYVQGEDLADVLKREGRLPIDRTLAIAKQVASGLAAAHAEGVVHRDLKPENIMIDADGTAIIMDFGIARSVSGTGTATQLGAVMGTLEYMAPEQAQGQQVDHRADIYTFGLILYDLIGGRWRASQHENPMSELMARMTQPLPPIKVVAPEATPAIDAIITKCLQPDPADRYQATAELVKDLENLDAQGHPIRKVAVAGARAPRWSTWAAAALAVVALAALGGAWWLVGSRGAPGPAAAREPVTVLIADFENHAGDPVFDGSLEQPLAIALEGAPFITAYSRRDALAVVEQVGQAKAVSRLDEPTARLVSQREGIKVILAGAVDRDGAGYRVTVKAVDAVPGTTLVTAQKTARSKVEVLQAVAGVASRIREALGDATPESEQLAAAETFTASSLDAARAYALGQQLGSNGKYEESIDYYKRAVDADPKFGRAYATWAVSAFSLGRKDEADELYKKAFSLLDRMTEREKYRTYGAYYLSVASNYEKAIENYSTLVKLYPADRAGHSNLALAYFYTLNFPKALEEGRHAIEIYRGSPKFRSNYALYAMYAGDFKTAAAEAAALVKDNPSYYRAYLPIAIAGLAESNPEGARAAYEQMAKLGAQGASLASIGLADLAMYYGRYAEAATLLASGIDADTTINNKAGAAAKYVALAEALEAQGERPRAVAAAQAAVKLLREPAILVPAARILVRAGRIADARAIASELAGRLQPQHRAYGRVVEAEIALQERRAGNAVTALADAKKLADLWLVRLDLGTAYVEAGASHHAEALSELELCTKRRGEATAMFLDDVPSFRYLAPLPYWLGRAQEGLGMRGPAAENYKAFLTLRPAPTPDPLAADARRRATR